MCVRVRVLICCYNGHQLNGFVEFGIVVVSNNNQGRLHTHLACKPMYCEWVLLVDQIVISHRCLKNNVNINISYINLVVILSTCGSSDHFKADCKFWEFRGIVSAWNESLKRDGYETVRFIGTKLTRSWAD